MRVLIITKTFPPVCSARSLQINKVVCAIHDAGVDIRVIAGSANNLPSSDFQLPGLTNRNIHYVSYSDDFKSGHSSFIPGKVLCRFLRELYQYRWIRQAAELSRRVMADFKPDIIFTSSNPIDSHLVGLILKRETGILWVTSYSDPWPVHIRPAPYHNSETPISRRWDMRVIRQLLDRCDAVHMPCEYALQLVEEKTGVSICRKSWAIPHIASEIPQRLKANHKRWLVHVGEISRERISLPLLQAIRRAASENKTIFQGLLCVGTVCPEFRHLITELAMEDTVRCMGSVGANEAANMMGQANALLVLEADMPMSPFLPSKFADYTSAGKPILAVTPPKSSIRDYLKRYGGGIAVGHVTDDIASAIFRIFSQESGIEYSSAQQTSDLQSLFTPQAVARQYMRMFKMLLDGTYSNPFGYHHVI